MYLSRRWRRRRQACAVILVWEKWNRWELSFSAVLMEDTQGASGATGRGGWNWTKVNLNFPLLPLLLPVIVLGLPAAGRGGFLRCGPSACPGGIWVACHSVPTSEDVFIKPTMTQIASLHSLVKMGTNLNIRGIPASVRLLWNRVLRGNTQHKLLSYKTIYKNRLIFGACHSHTAISLGLRSEACKVALQVTPREAPWQSKSCSVGVTQFNTETQVSVSRVRI